MPFGWVINEVEMKTSQLNHLLILGLTKKLSRTWLKLKSRMGL
jgi:hypothetical protein